MARAPLRRQAPKVGAVCLNRARTVLSGGRIARYVPTGKVARHGDRPHQLQPLLGQPVPRAVDRRGLRVDAGTAPVCGGHQLRPGTGMDAAGTLPETGGTGGRLSTAHRRAPAAIVSVSGDFPAHGVGTGSIAWVGRQPHHAKISRLA